MLQSKLFTKTERLAPKDEQAKNAQLLVRAGFIDKLMAGVYSFLPLGFLVLKNIEKIIREEMNAAGGQEILMPALHPVENYERTGRQDIDVLFRTKLGDDKSLVLGQSHEEIIVPLVKKFIHSYRDLPLAVYQIQTKFRNELRAKSGLFRGREFMMKDLYSFHLTEEDFELYYETMKAAYRNVFRRAGIADKTFFTYASGGTFSQFSHEFQTVTESGEDTISLCDSCKVAVNEEIRGTVLNCPECKGALGNPVKSIEVANIFPLGTRFSSAFDMNVKDESGKEAPVIMGCYGIGLSRLMGTVAELYGDEKGLIWPQELSPFRVHLIAIGDDAKKESFKVYEALQKKNISILYDDREGSSTGEKFADADLIGIPTRAVISSKTLAEREIEFKDRKTGDTAHKSISQFIEQLC